MIGMLKSFEPVHIGRHAWGWAIAWSLLVFLALWGNATELELLAYSGWFALWLLGLCGIGLSYHTLAQNLGKRRQIEEDLREQRNLLETILSSSDDLIALKNQDLVYTVVNPAFCEFHGKTREEILGRSDFDLVPRQQAEWRRQMNLATLSSGRISKEDVEVENDQGRFWLQVSQIPVFDANGETIGLLCSIHNITDRKRTEESLRQYERIVSASHEHMAFVDREYIYRAVNESHVLDFKKSREEIVGHSMADLLGRDFFEGVVKPQINRAFAGETVRFENWFDLPGWGRRYHEVTFYPFFGGNGTVTGAVVNVRDTTDRKQVDEHLRRAQKMESIGTLAGGIAHDFNNILQPILGYAQLSMNTLPRESEHHEHLEEIVKSVKRAAELIKQILTFSRQAEQERQIIRLQPLVKEICKSLRAFLPSTIEIREEIHIDCGPIYGDVSQIHQIMMNLATNAYHAMREKGGVLTVKLAQAAGLPREVSRDKTTAARGYAQLSIADTGHGMNREIREKIFEPYFTTKEPGEGTGLGLAMVHGIVKTHEGKISVHSIPGQGSRFDIYFPLSEAECCRKDPVKQEAGAKRMDAQVLFVDDEEIIAHLGQKLLERLGCRVSAFNDSRMAWEAFAEAPEAFDLVITDQIMPHLTGTDLARKILNRRPEVPIVLITGYSELVNEEQAKAIGIREYLMKPLTTDELLAALKRVLGPAGE